MSPQGGLLAEAVTDLAWQFLRLRLPGVHPLAIGCRKLPIAMALGNLMLLDVSKAFQTPGSAS